MLPANKEVYNSFKEWHNWLLNQRKYSKNTVSSYQIDVKEFISFINTHTNNEVTLKSLDTIVIKDLRSWVAYRLEKKFDFASTSRAISAVRNYYKFLTENYNISNTSIFFLKMPKQKKRLPNSITKEQTFSMLSSIMDIADEEWIAKRDMALLILIYACGLRISEALSIKLLDLDNNATLRIKGKGNKERVVPILPIIIEAINDYLKSCPYIINNDDYIFLGKRGKVLNPSIFQKTIRETRKLANLPDNITPHAFRHSFATHLLQADMNLRSIQELLGHAKLSTTQNYTKVDTSQILKNYSDFHPRK